VLREQNHLRRADRVLDEALARAGRARRSVAQAVHAVERAQWYLATSQPDQGLELLMRFRTDADVPPPTTIDTRMRSVEARLLVAVGDFDRAEAVLHNNEGPWTSDLAAASVQVALACDDESAAKQRQGDWPDDPEPGPRLERGLWTAIVESRYGNRREALERLADVVAIAEPDGHTRVFIDAGVDAARLMQTLYRTSPTPYLRRLAEPSPGPAPFPSGTPDLASTLSTRELAVVRYLPSRLSSAEIAEHLYISLNTLKTHLRSIYRKLGVESRREAFEKAKEQGIA
jgi:LuxR family maltose regulon positive regulatory protein